VQEEQQAAGDARESVRNVLLLQANIVRGVFAGIGPLVYLLQYSVVLLLDQFDNSLVGALT
jgi:hypothetical protein